MSSGIGSALDGQSEVNVEITLLDPLGRGIDGLKYQVREGAKILASGVTDGQGKVKAFKSSAGTHLAVYVECFDSGDMKKIKTFIPSAQNFKVKLLSGKIKERMQLQPASGKPGTYKRKTYVAKAGDTFEKLGKQYGTTAEMLARLNGLKWDEAIREGQVIKVLAEGGSRGEDERAVEKGPKAEVRSDRPILKSTDVEGEIPIIAEKSEERGSNGTPKTTINLKCGQSCCIKLGMTGPIVEEINIRLMGFGGSVLSFKPLDEFTTQTEAAVKQFQRDYMSAPETGKVCGAVIRAIDEFRSGFPVSLNDMKCRCGKCDGFGKQRKNSDSVELHRDGKSIEGIEYPGIHRALLWLFRSSLFYTSIKDKELGYSFLAISSGYRCWDNNKLHGRGTTNHMGNALDLQFGKGTSSTRCTGHDLESLRKKIFMARLGAQMRWNEKNRPALESTADGAISWVHIDLQTYGEKFKDNKYYAATQSKVDGEPLVDVAKQASMFALVNCGGIPPRKPNQIL